MDEYIIRLLIENLLTDYFTGPELMKDSREYLGTVQSICLNADYAAVYFEGKVQLHMVIIF